MCEGLENDLRRLRPVLRGPGIIIAGLRVYGDEGGVTDERARRPSWVVV